MSQQFILETSGLRLRPFSIGDASELFHLNSDPLVLQYTGDVPFKDANEAVGFILNYVDYRQYGYGRLAVIAWESNTFLGWCGLKYSPEKQETDIGFRFHRKYWGQGFATEAAKVCLDFGFAEIGLTRIVGRAHISNKASHKVLEKIGMTQIGSFVEGFEEWLVFERVKP